MHTARWLPLAIVALIPLAAVGCVSPADDDGDSTGGAGATGGAGGATGGDGGTGGTGGSGPPANDQCPGEAVPLAWGESFQASGTTAEATDDFSSFCTELAVPLKDVVWAVTLEQPSSVTITASGTPQPALYVQSECGADTFPAYCFETMSTSFASHLDAGTWYVTVDGEGAFELDIRAEEPACGDGVVNTGEQCDTGPGAALDGCVDPGDELECTFGDLDPSLGVCPGQPHTIDPGATFLLASENNLFTTGYADTHESNVCGNFEGPNRVHAFTPTAAGTLSVTIGLDEAQEIICHNATSTPGCWDHVLYARTACDEPATEIGCADEINNETNPSETLSFPVEANVPYYVFVDGYDATAFGPYNLLVELN